MNSKSKNEQGSGGPKTLLLVDDDASARQMIGRVLADEGHHILYAANGAEALELAATNAIDLVLLDLNMPVKGGWDTFEQLTANNPLLAVIIITARPNQLFTSLAAGVGALLEKPLDFQKLLETVRSLLDESTDLRLKRLTGNHADLYYLPSTGKESRE